MSTFEVFKNNKKYLHYDNWIKWRQDRLNEYPCPLGHWRFDIELSCPRNTLEEIPVDFNPHKTCAGHNLIGADPAVPFSPHTYFYRNNDWSSIHGVYDFYFEQTGENGYRMLIESGHDYPWGERITLYSTSQCIVDPPWQGENQSNKFAFFRGQFWKITWAEFLHPFPWGCGHDNPFRLQHKPSPLHDRITINTIKNNYWFIPAIIRTPTIPYEITLSLDSDITDYYNSHKRYDGSKPRLL